MKKSILTDSLNSIYEAPSLDTAKMIFKGLVESSRINDQSKRIMLLNATKCTTLLALQTYATNSMFQYNGMGVK